MSFLKKTWLARIGVGLNRFRMNNSTDVVLESNPVSVTQQGDQLSADNMNNLETRIDNAFTEMAGNLATIEVSPSQHNWTVGSQIVYNGILYKVTSAISTDDNLVVGTNISPYPVSSAISDISEYVVDQTAGKTFTFPSLQLIGVGRDNNVDTFIPFPFATKNTNYSISIVQFQIYNVVGATTNYSIIGKTNTGFRIRYTASSNMDYKSWWTVIDNLTITFA